MGATAAITAIGTATTAYGQAQEGRAAESAANFTAEQLARRAGRERASAQRQAIEESRRARLVESRARAVAAAGGGGVDDPTVQDILAGIAAEGQFRALSALYEGDERATGLEMQAELTRGGGRAARYAGRAAAYNTITSAAGSYAGGRANKTMWEKYGEGSDPDAIDPANWMSLTGDD